VATRQASEKRSRRCALLSGVRSDGALAFCDRRFARIEVGLTLLDVCRDILAAVVFVGHFAQWRDGASDHTHHAYPTPAMILPYRKLAPMTRRVMVMLE